VHKFGVLSIIGRTAWTPSFLFSYATGYICIEDEWFGMQVYFS
jgi:hypothetical protein